MRSSQSDHLKFIYKAYLMHIISARCFSGVERNYQKTVYFLKLKKIVMVDKGCSDEKEGQMVVRQPFG